MVLLIVQFSKNKCIIDYQLNSAIKQHHQQSHVVNLMTIMLQKYNNTPKL